MAQDYLTDIALIKKRAVSGIVTFTLRTLLIQVFTFFATFLLTIFLDPSIFGIFFVVSALINLFVYFSDIGLAAALIQKNEEPTKDDLATTFTLQQAIIVILISAGLIFSAKIASFYRLDHNGFILLRVLFFSLFLSSLKTIPSIILERQLNFTKLVIPQVAENLVFYSTAVILAISGFGLMSFTWAVLLRGLVGLALIYWLSPWKISLSLNFESAKKLASFGLPFQTNSILALIKDDLLTAFLGKILPFSSVGYIGWAQKWAYIPLRFFMDSVNKVTFPAYSRLQEHQAELAKAIEKSLFFVAYLVYPSAFGMAAIAPFIISTIPKYTKWEPALPLLYLFAASTLFSAISTTITNALFAIGRPKIVLEFMVFWTALTWILTYPLVLKYGFTGVAIASLIVALTSLATVYVLKKQLNVNVSKNIFGPLLVSIVMFFSVKGLETVLTKNVINLILIIISGAIIYFIVSFGLLRRKLIGDMKTILNALFLKS